MIGKKEAKCGMRKFIAEDPKLQGFTILTIFWAVCKSEVWMIKDLPRFSRTLQLFHYHKLSVQTPLYFDTQINLYLKLRRSSISRCETANNIQYTNKYLFLNLLLISRGLPEVLLPNKLLHHFSKDNHQN